MARQWHASDRPQQVLAICLKALNGELSLEQAETATATCLRLADELLAPSASYDDADWRHAALAGKELGLEYPDGVATKIAGGAESALAKIVQGAWDVMPVHLLHIWVGCP